MRHYISCTHGCYFNSLMKNLTARTVTIHQGVKVATMGAANVVPHMLAPEEAKVSSPPENFESNEITPLKGASIVKDPQGSSVDGRYARWLR